MSLKVSKTPRNGKLCVLQMGASLPWMTSVKCVYLTWVDLGVLMRQHIRLGDVSEEEHFAVSLVGPSCFAICWPRSCFVSGVCMLFWQFHGVCVCVLSRRCHWALAAVFLGPILVVPPSFASWWNCCRTLGSTCKPFFQYLLYVTLPVQRLTSPFSWGFLWLWARLQPLRWHFSLAWHRY